MQVSEICIFDICNLTSIFVLCDGNFQIYFDGSNISASQKLPPKNFLSFSSMSFKVNIVTFLNDVVLYPHIFQNCTNKI